MKQKQWKRIGCLLLALVLVAGYFPVTALAADTANDVVIYQLYVSGTLVTSKNATDVLGDGTVSYNGETKTLTLDGANIAAASANGSAVDYGIIAGANLNVVVGSKGAQIVGGHYGIESYGDITISGGALTVKDVAMMGIYANQKNLTINNCDLTVLVNENGGHALCTGLQGKITINGSNVELHAGNSGDNSQFGMGTPEVVLGNNVHLISTGASGAIYGTATLAAGVTGKSRTAESAEFVDGIVYNSESYFEFTNKDAGHNYGQLIEATEAVHTQDELKGAVAAHYQCADCLQYFDADKNETTLEALTSEVPVHNYENGKCECGRIDNSCGENVYWTLDETTGTLTISGTGPMADYSSGTAPWYNKRYAINSVVIEPGVTTIGNYAFYYYTDLTEITVPTSITSIGSYAFANCCSLTEITIPTSVTTIGSHAFDSCNALKQVSIPESVTTIGSAAFGGCMELAEVNIPSSVTSIGSSAFQGCEVLTRVTIPATVTSIGNYMFADCPSLAEVILQDGITQISAYMFMNCYSLTEITIPASVTTIGSQAFASCEGLTRVTMSASATTIGSAVFRCCPNLSEVNLQEGVTQLGASMFLDCDGLEEITIPVSVKSIDSKAFENCHNLTKLTFLGDTPNLHEEAFVDLFATAYYPCNNVTWTEDKLQNYGGTITWVPYGGEHVHEFGEDGECECGVIGGTCGDNLTWVLDDVGTLTISGTGPMADYSSGTAPWYNSRSKITAVVMESGVTTIGNYAFGSCSNLTEITLPESITTIGSSAFYGCRGLTEITIPASVTSIGGAAFRFCSGLTEITIPASVTTIGSYAFQSCTGLTKITFQGHAPKLDNYAFSGVTATAHYPASSGTWTAAKRQNYGGTLTWEPYGDEHVHEFGEDDTCICGAIRGYCGGEGDGTNLTWILDAEGNLTIFGTGAMADYEYGTAPWYNSRSKITSVVMESGVTTIGNFAFLNCSDLKKITIPWGVTTIGNDAFYYCFDLTGVIIPESVTTIGNCAFYGCDGLTEITIPASVTTIGDSAFFSCDGLTEVTIPATVTSFGSYVFSGCSNLSEVVLEEGVTQISGSMFSNCDSLTEITIPASVTTIGISAFSNCDGLTEVTIPATVTSIDGFMFSGCSNLSNVVLEEGITQISMEMFSNCDSLTEITIPASVKSIRSSAFEDCENLTKVTFLGDAPAASMGLGSSFESLTATAYYPANNDTWTEEKMQAYGGTITWVPYCTGEHIPGEPYVDEKTKVESNATTKGYHYEVTDCSVCGTELSREKKDALLNPFTSAADLGNGLAMNFIINTTTFEGTDNYVVITRSFADGTPSEEYTIQQKNWKLRETNKYTIKSYSNLAATQMTDQFTLTLYNAAGEQLSVIREESVRAYAMRAINGTMNNPAKVNDTRMFVDLLNYGAAAQNFFGYNQDDLANALLTDEQQAFATKAEDMVVANNQEKGNGYSSTTLEMEGKLTLNMLFSKSVVTKSMKAVISYTDHAGKDVKYTIQGSKFKTHTNNRYRVEITGLAVPDGATMITCEIYDASGNLVTSAVDSINSYLSRAVSASAANANNVYGMLLRFTQSAYAKFHP